MNLLDILEIIKKKKKSGKWTHQSDINRARIVFLSKHPLFPINQIQGSYKFSSGPQQSARDTKAFWCVLQDSCRGQAYKFIVTKLAVVWAELPDHIRNLHTSTLLAPNYCQKLR